MGYDKQGHIGEADVLRLRLVTLSRLSLPPPGFKDL